MVLTWDFHRSKVLVYKHAAGTTGIADLPVQAYNSNMIEAAPNPFSSRITIKVDGNGKGKNIDLKIFDIKGKMIKSFSSIHLLPSTFYLQAEGLSPGIYLLKLQIGNQQYSKKIILQK
jgi:hypothetical protein